MDEASERRERLHRSVRAEADRRERAVKIGLLAVSLLTIGLLAVAALRENVFTEWRHYQRQYARILKEKAADPRGRKLAQEFRVEMRQIVVPELSAIDRCVSCHEGMDDPRMTDVPNPHAVHPGDYLAAHEVSRFGCTICHRGQGRAMDLDDAKAEGRHWDYPLLPVELSQSSCGLCHSAREVADRGGEVYAAGVALFEIKGCRSCHKLGGRGGNLGPALDNEGLKVSGQLPMAAVKGPHTLPEWMLEHFADPQRIVAGSRMPCPGLNRGEATALTTFLLSLQKRDLPGSYLTPERHLQIYAEAHPELASGMQLYSRYCSTCHDTGTIGRYDKFFAAFIPAIRGETFVRIADPAYVAANIRLGRMGTIMVGVDGSVPSAAALRFAAEEARVRGARLRVVHAWHLPLLPGGETSGADLEYVELRRADAERLLTEAVAEIRLEAEGVEIDSAAVEGRAAKVLVDEARDADLLVVGSRGRGGFAGLLLGSVGQQCAQHAICPVAIVRRVA